MSDYIGKALIVVGDATETVDTLYPSAIAGGEH